MSGWMGMGRMLAESGRGKTPRWTAGLLAGLAAALLCFSSACGRANGCGSAAGAPVVLISIDTLRADHLPAYGYRGVATPHIDALARRSLLFEHAYTPCPLTLPAHPSLLSGRLPPAHGVRNNLGYVLSPEVPTLPRL